jgi:NodT family efflux transporter outer membrane factor (OMF) lipoprotein
MASRLIEVRQGLQCGMIRRRPFLVQECHVPLRECLDPFFQACRQGAFEEACEMIQVTNASTTCHSHGHRLAHPRINQRTAFLVFAILLTSVAGCTSWRDYIKNGFKVGPNYCRPKAEVSDTWLDSKDAALRTDVIQESAWWRNLEDPVLDSLVTTAYRQNLSVRVAGLRILEARAQRAIAAGELFPQSQQAFGDYARTGVSAYNPSAVPGMSRFGSEWRLGTSLAWELDFWGQFRRALESADAKLDSSIENYDNVLVLLIADVANAYSNVRIAEQRLEYAHKNVEIQRGSLKIAEDRFHNGATTKLDVTQGESNLAQTEATIPPLETARRQAVNQLCILLGMPPQNMDDTLAGHKGIPVTPPQIAVGIPAELIRRRPDVRQAERDVAAQSALIGVAQADLYPHFSITGTLFLDAEKFEDLWRGNAVSGSFGPTFNWNIFNYGRLVNSVRVQEARFQELAITYQNIVLRADAEAENAIVSFLKAQQQVQYLKQSTVAAKESVELVSAQYREGKVDFNRVYNVQQTLTQQEDQLAVAQGTVVTSLIGLYKSLGGGWQIRLEDAGSPANVVNAQPAAPTPAPAPAPTPAPVPTTMTPPVHAGDEKLVSD